MKAKDIGEEMKRLQATTVGFSEPFKKRKVLTFGVMGKKKTTKASGKERTLKADRKLFAELMLVGSTRKVQLEEMLKHHLGPFPLSIPPIHSALVKTNKALLLQKE